MKYTFLLLIFFIIADLKVTAQASYAIDTFTTKYDTLTDYQSLVYDLFIQGEYPGLFDEDFNLGFEMPFWDAHINKLSLNQTLVGIIEGSIEFNFFLFAADWQIYDPVALNADTTFYSDYRYKRGIKNDLKYFALEFRHVSHNNFLDHQPQNEKGDFNFQTWFWENGDIEMRFGNVLSSDTTIYKEGFGLITGDENGEGQWNAGLLGFDNDTNTNGIYYVGDYQNPRIIRSALLLNEAEIKPLSTLPHEGFVIRFKYESNSSTDQEDNVVNFYPNPCNDIIFLKDALLYDEIALHDLAGRPMPFTIQDENINISDLNPGCYIFTLMKENKIQKAKVIKL